MAIITEVVLEKHLGPGKNFIHVESASATPADTVLLDDLHYCFPHNFLGVQMFDAQGDRVVASAGEFQIQVKTLNTQVYEDVPEPAIDATAPTTVSWDGNTTGVRVVPSGVTDVASWKLVLTMNRS